MTEGKISNAFSFLKDLTLDFEKRRLKGDSKYRLNQENLDKFSKMYDGLCSAASVILGRGISSIDIGHGAGQARVAGQLIKVEISPESSQARVSIELPALEMHPDIKSKIVNATRYMDSFDITQTGRGTMLVSAAVNGVWEADE